MTSIDEFITLIHQEIGIEMTPEHLGQHFDQVPGWDSLHLLTLLTALERTTGRPVPMPDVLEATSLEGIYQLAVTG